jgi:hypothetical protein
VIRTHWSKRNAEDQTADHRAASTSIYFICSQRSPGKRSARGESAQDCEVTDAAFGLTWALMDTVSRDHRIHQPTAGQDPKKSSAGHVDLEASRSSPE